MTEFLVTSSVLIAVLLILRFLFREKISRRLQYALWGVVLLRLLMPFPLPGSPFSVMNAVPGGPSASELTVREVSGSSGGIAPAASAAAGSYGYSALPGNAAAAPFPAAADPDGILRLVWVIGSAAVGLWIVGINLVFYIRLRRTRKACAAADFKLPVYVGKSIASPCLFGVFHPAVYLTPKSVENEDNIRYALAHESCHYRHGDHIWSVLREVCLAVYWWDPFVWAAAIFSHADGELACDEAVIRQIGEENRLAYGYTLVDMIAVKKASSNILCTATTMASGKRGIKARLNMIIKNPKTFIPALAAVLVVVAVCIAVTFTGAWNGAGKAGESGNSAASAQSVNSSSSAQGKNISEYAQKLYGSRVQYIGDAPADDALLGTFGISEKFGGYTLELETKSEPYVLRVVFAGKITDAAAADQAMSRNAALLLALIHNASEIQWQYTTGVDRTLAKSVGSLSESRANDLLGGNIKDYGKSAQQIQALLDRLNAGVAALDQNRAQSSRAADAANLDACVSNAILSRNAGQYLQGKFAAESHINLKTVESGNTATVYAMVLYLEFEYPDGMPSDVSGSHMPVAITFQKDADGAYGLKEYWMPTDGSKYESSIRKKFPSDIAEGALDTQRSILSQMQDCYTKAIGYGKVDTDAALTKLLKTVCSSPAGQSNPKAYIDAHLIEYQRMTYYGNNMLRYGFSRFEKGGRTGLAGSIMASACRDILGETEAGSPAATGQGWYDAFKKSAIDQRLKNGDDYLKKNRPGSWLLLQMLGKTGESSIPGRAVAKVSPRVLDCKRLSAP